MVKSILFTLSAILFLSKGWTQSVTPSITNAGGGSWVDPYSYLRYFDWSIGELTLVDTKASQDSSIFVYQGVLQPCTEKPGNSPLTANFDNGDFKIFPNPTVGKFEINFFVRANGTMHLHLTNALGQIMERRSFRYYGCCHIEHYDISHLPSGVYFIIATLIPDPVNTSESQTTLKHSGLRVVKVR
jgi:hypothetical protein